MTTHEVTSGDGRTLAVTEAGTPGGPVLLSQHGTPGSGRLYRTEIEGAERLGARLVAYDRPGYGSSTPNPGRGVPNPAGEFPAIPNALGPRRSPPPAAGRRPPRPPLPAPPGRPLPPPGDNPRRGPRQ